MNRKITKIENSFTQQQAVIDQQQQRQQHVRKVHRRRLQVIGLLLVVVLGFCGFQIFKTHQSLNQVNQATTVKKRKLSQAKTQHQQLKIQVSQLHNDDYLAKYIRYKYYYSKKGEIIYSLPQDKAANLTKQQK